MTDQDEPKLAGYFDPLSGVARYIRMYFGEIQLASGTCFFVMSADGPVLVTNRHNFTGRINFTGELLHKKGGIPNHAVVTLQGPGEVHYHIDLVDHTDQEAPAWTEHPTLGAKADIVALPVKEMTNIIGESNSVSLGNDWHRWDVGSELHVIGYPYGQIGGRSRYGRKASSHRNPMSTLRTSPYSSSIADHAPVSPVLPCLRASELETSSSTRDRIGKPKSP